MRMATSMRDETECLNVGLQLTGRYLDPAHCAGWQEKMQGICGAKGTVCLAPTR